MMASLSRRKLVLGAGLAVTLGLVVWVDRQEQQVDGGIELSRPQTATSSIQPRSAGVNDTGKTIVTPPVSLDWEVLAGRKAATAKPETSVNLFRSHSWYVPPPRPVAPPPAPAAPAVPFVYLGKMEDTPQGTLLILSASNKMYTVSIGETLNQTWRLEGEDANSVRFTYLPLGLPQTLFKAAKPAAARPVVTNKIENQETIS